MFFSKKQNSILFLVFSLQLILYYILGFQLQRSNFTLYFTCLFFLFISYLILVKLARSFEHFNTLLVFSLMVKILLLFNVPVLSDDFYRFIWDGQIMHLGINPFDSKPSELIKLVGFQKLIDLFPLLNSPHYFSVYPGSIQGINYLVNYIDIKNIQSLVIGYKSAFLLLEIFTWKYLYSLLKNQERRPQLFFLFILNPLILLDVYSNIHFEFICIQFLILFFYWAQKKKVFKSALFMALAVSTKIIPLLILPIYLLGWKRKNIFVFGLFFLSAILAINLPFLHTLEHLSHLKSSLNLYFQTFEFNSFLFYDTLQWVQNLLGISFKDWSFLFSLAFIIAYTYLVLKVDGNDFKKILLIFLVYFITSTVFHPWYLSTILLLGILSQIYTPVLWSFLIGISYMTYSYIPYSQPKTGLLIVNTVIIICLIIELNVSEQKKRKYVDYFF